MLFLSFLHLTTKRGNMITYQSEELRSKDSERKT